MKSFRLDFETRSEADIKKVGAWRYAEDPSTEILCFAYRIDGQDVKLWTPGSEDPLDLLSLVLSKDFVFRAHNAEFETAIWFHQLFKKRGWPMLPASSARCTAAKAAAMGLPRKLEDVGAALRLPIQKDKEGSRIMLKLAKPRKPTIANPEKWHNDPADFLRLYQYCTVDVLSEEAIDRVLPDLTPAETEIFLLDQKINRRGIYIDLKSVKSALSFCEKYAEELQAELAVITEGRIQTAGQAAKIVEELGQYGVNIPDLTKGTVEEALKPDGLNPTARRILEIRQALALSSTKKLNSMEAMAGADSRARGTMLYHGAGTGRWAGRLLQVQNFPRGSLKEDKIDRAFELYALNDYATFRQEFPDVLSAVSSTLRGMIAAPPGKKLVAADFSAIEARVIFWLAGCARGVREYELYDQGKGPEVYCLMAKEIYGREIIKGRDNTERALGKSTILGAGFGMGKDKFYDTCTAQNVAVTLEQAETAINTYRETYREVRAFWYALEDAAVKAVKNPGQVFQVGFIKYCVKGDYLFAKLPSGRNIAYYRPHFKMAKTSWGEDKLALHYWTVNSQSRKFEPVPTYGGKLAENCFGGDTLVLTDQGLIKIKDVKDQKIWDGESFVDHGGIICKKNQEVIQWCGVQVTGDHKILVSGGLWLPVIDLVERSKRVRLYPARVSAYLRLLYRELVTTRQRFYGVTYAASNSQKTLERCSDTTKQRAPIAPTRSPAKNVGAKSVPKSSQIMKPAGDGYFGLKGYAPDAIIRSVRRSITTGGGALKTNGARISWPSWPTLLRFLIGTRPASTLTGLITKAITRREIFALCRGGITRTTSEIIPESVTLASRSLLPNFGAAFFLIGQVLIAISTMLKGAVPRKKLKRSTIPVYDVLNCGPNSRFAIMTSRGPALAHNCTQGVARDLMAHALKSVEAAGYGLIMSVHDEAVSEVDKNFGNAKDFAKIMTIKPDWAAGLPIAAEGWEGPRFKK